MKQRLSAWWISLFVLAGCAGPDSAPIQDATDRRASPEGLIEAIVYTTTRPPNFDIFIFEGQEATPRRLTHHNATDYNAVFSPDGRWVAFTS